MKKAKFFQLLTHLKHLIRLQLNLYLKPGKRRRHRSSFHLQTWLKPIKQIQRMLDKLFNNKKHKKKK
jgi:hypothetical protein